MTAEIVNLNVVTTLDLNPERVLDAAKAAKLTGVVVIGWDADGIEYMKSSIADGGEVCWLIERYKYRLMSGVDE
jgi:hypothetical protein